MTSTYTSRPVNRRRRTKAELAAIDEQIIAVLVEENPATLRNVYYRLLAAHVVDKGDPGYNVVQRQLLKLRRSGDVPYDWVTDGTRLRQRPATWSSLEAALHRTARTYRRALWDRTSEVVEVWCESDSLGGVLLPVTKRLDVPLMTARGFSSESYLWTAAREYRQIGRPVVVYYFGDWDPSGWCIGDKVQESLRGFAPEVDFTFTRVAVTPEQVVTMALPSDPPNPRDTRTKAFVKYCADRGFDPVACQAEAIRPTLLREMCEQRITAHLDSDELQLLEMVEAEEREVLTRMARREFR